MSFSEYPITSFGIPGFHNSTFQCHMMPHKRGSRGDLETKLEWLQTKFLGDQAIEIRIPEQFQLRQLSVFGYFRTGLFWDNRGFRITDILGSHLDNGFSINKLRLSKLVLFKLDYLCKFWFKLIPFKITILNIN